MIITPNVVELTGLLLAEIRDAKTDELLERIFSDNLVVNTGRNLIRDRMNNSGNALSHFALGTNNTAVTSADTALGTEVFRAAFTSVTTDVGKLTVKYYLASGSANGNTLREAGVFNAAGAGTMYCRTVLASVIVKTISVTVTFTWDLLFQAV